MRLFLNIFLICSSTIYAMELTITTHSYNGIMISDDLFATEICSRFNRPARDAIRCTCKKYYHGIFSQDTLNNNYEKACNQKDNAQIIHWKSLGAFLPHQELAYAIKDNKRDLAKWLLAKDKVNVWNAYCRNTEEAVKTATVEQMLPVIRWLLYSREPAIHLSEFLSGYHFAHDLKKQYPDVQKIIDVFKEYKYERKEAQKRASNRSYDRGLPWHMRGDY